MTGGRSQLSEDPRRRNNFWLRLHAEISVSVVNSREGIKD